MTADAHTTTAATNPSRSVLGRPRTLAGWHLSTVMLLLLGGCFPLLFTNLRLASLSAPPVVLALLVTAWSAFRLVGLLVRGEPRLIQATFWIFVYVWFGLAALAETVDQRFPILNQEFSSDLQVRALVIILVGLAAYEVGVAVRNTRPQSSPALRWLDVRTVQARRVWYIAGFGLIAVAIAAWTLGLGTLFSSRTTLTSAFIGSPSPTLRPDQVTNKAAGLLKANLTWAPVFLGCYLLLLLRRKHTLTGSGRVPLVTTYAATVLLIALVIGNLIANNPVGNPRYRFAGVGFALLVAYWPLRSAYRFRIVVGGLLVGILFVFPFADVFRYDDRLVNINPLKSELVESPNFAMYQQEVNAQLYVDEHGYTFGVQTIGAALVFVPRSLWPGKPIDTGNLIVRTDIINASASLWATVFVDGGWLAVGFVFLLYGWFTGACEEAFVRRPTSLSFAAIFVPLFAGFQIFFLRGDLQPAVGELAILPLLLFFATRTPSKPRSETSTTSRGARHRRSLAT